MTVQQPTSVGAVVEHSVVVSAPPMEVWQAVVDPHFSPRWMGGFRFVSSWEIGDPISVRGILNGREYSESGTVLALEPGALLRYDHWSRLWRVPDLPENRAVLELRLEPVAAGTEIRFRHELPAVKALAEHSRFFWRGALYQLRKLMDARGADPDEAG